METQAMLIITHTNWSLGNFCKALNKNLKVKSSLLNCKEAALTLDMELCRQLRRCVGEIKELIIEEQIMQFHSHFLLFSMKPILKFTGSCDKLITLLHDIVLLAMKSCSNELTKKSLHISWLIFSLWGLRWVLKDSSRRSARKSGIVLEAPGCEMPQLPEKVVSKILRLFRFIWSMASRKRL